MAHFIACPKAEKVGAVQCEHLRAPSRGYREAGEGLFIRNWSDSTRGRTGTNQKRRNLDWRLRSLLGGEDLVAQGMLCMPQP